MRNGNLWSMAIDLRGRPSSYPTYEEWKQVKGAKTELDYEGSYPTYEEWKLQIYLINLDMTLVLILPMRNGNSHLSKILP